MSNDSRPTILIIDDIPENLEILMEMLKEEYRVMAAKGGRKGLDLAFAEPPPDLILLDIVMPEMDGFEVCRRLKQDARTIDIPVIFISGLSEEEEETRGLALGGVDFLSKPFRPAMVKLRIRNQLELKKCRGTPGHQGKDSPNSYSS